MDLGIKGRKAIICASTRGLGKACAVALAEAGCEVVINGRDPAAMAEAAEEIRDRYGVVVHEVIADVSTREGQRALLAACPEPDILVNNNGGPSPKNFRDLDRDQMIAGVIGNLITPIELIQSVIDGMAERGFGRIVNITSTTVYQPVERLELSSAARAGLQAFLGSVSRSVAAKNVTINNLLPGTFYTDRSRAMAAEVASRTERSVEEVVAERASTRITKRFGRPEEFGAACAFLCAATSGYIVGQSIRIDGGTYASSF